MLLETPGVVRQFTGSGVFLWRYDMSAILSLDERLDAYLAVVNAEPDLTIAERQHLFSFALWPQKDEVDYAHLMQCRERFCGRCEPPDGHPFAPVVDGKLAA